MKILLVNFTKSMVSSVNETFAVIKAKAYIVEKSAEFNKELELIKAQIAIINVKENSLQETRNLIKAARRSKFGKNIYLLVMIPKNMNFQEVLDAGADDCIFKAFSKDELYLRLTIAQKNLKIKKNLNKAQKNMLKLAKEDPQTNLLNRRALLDNALAEMGRASRDDHFISAILVSIINFKQLITSYGSKTIDDLLLKFSNRLETSCRPYDMIGRLNISDFLVLMPGVTSKNAKTISQRIIEIVANSPYTLANNEKIMIPIAIGIAELDPAEVPKSNKVDDRLMNDLILDSLIRRSEMAMNNASQQGRNNYEIYTS